MKKILVCVPTFNESENIKILCKKILRIKKIDLLIVDDNSPDKTWAVVENLRIKNNFHIILISFSLSKYFMLHQVLTFSKLKV